MWGDSARHIASLEYQIGQYKKIITLKDEAIAILEDTVNKQQKLMSDMVAKVEELRTPLPQPPPAAPPQPRRVPVDKMGRTLSQHMHPDQWRYDHMAPR